MSRITAEDIDKATSHLMAPGLIDNIQALYANHEAVAEAAAAFRKKMIALDWKLLTPEAQAVVDAVELLMEKKVSDEIDELKKATGDEWMRNKLQEVADKVRKLEK